MYQVCQVCQLGEVVDPLTVLGGIFLLLRQCAGMASKYGENCSILFWEEIVFDGAKVCSSSRGDAVAPGYVSGFPKCLFMLAGHNRTLQSFWCAELQVDMAGPDLRVPDDPACDGQAFDA